MRGWDFGVWIEGVRGEEKMRGVDRASKEDGGVKVVREASPSSEDPLIAKYAMNGAQFGRPRPGQDG